MFKNLGKKLKTVIGTVAGSAILAYVLHLLGVDPEVTKKVIEATTGLSGAAIVGHTVTDAVAVNANARKDAKK